MCSDFTDIRGCPVLLSQGPYGLKFHIHGDRNAVFKNPYYKLVKGTSSFSAAGNRRARQIVFCCYFFLDINMWNNANVCLCTSGSIVSGLKRNDRKFTSFNLGDCMSHCHRTAPRMGPGFVFI